MNELGGWVTVSQEAIEDAPLMREGLAVLMGGTPPAGRYKNVWRQGYYAALDDLRSGRLVLKDGWFDFGPQL